MENLKVPFKVLIKAVSQDKSYDMQGYRYEIFFKETFCHYPDIACDRYDSYVPFAEQHTVGKILYQQ